MDNIIASTLLSGVSVSMTDKTLTAMPEELPPEFKAGDILLLNAIITTTNTFKNGDLFKLFWQPQQGEPQPLNVRLNAPLRLDGQIGDARQFSAKVLSDGSLQLQPLKTQLPPTNTPVAAAPVVKNTTALPPITFQPLKIAPVINNLMSELDFPPRLQETIMQNLPPTEVLVALKSIDQPEQLTTNLLQPLKTTLSQMLPLADKPQQLAPLVQNLVQNIKNLDGKIINAKPAAEPLAANTSAAFDTPLGRVLSEQPIKLPPETTLQLEIKSTPADKQLAEFPLLKTVAEALAKILPDEGFVRIQPSQLLQNLRGQDDSLLQILRIFEPLQQNSPQLASQLLQKFPGLKTDILSNTYSFYKAALKHDAGKWLGAELIKDIGASTPRGAETIAQLESLVSNSARETPLWRVIDIPFFNGGQIMPLQIALKKDAESESEKSKSEKGARFMINTVFSKLGAFQFDGFAVATERRFDLIIRTDRNHQQDFCSHIINLFKKSLYDVGYVGTIKINQHEAFIKVEPADTPREGVYV